MSNSVMHRPQWLALLAASEAGRRGDVVALVALAAVLGFVAWPTCPALAALIPLAWAGAGSRWAAALVGGAFTLAAARAGVGQFGSPWLSAMTCIGATFVAAAVYGALWSVRPSPIPMAARCVALLIATLVLSAVLPGHPLFGWGYLVQGWGWNGVVVMTALSAGGAALMRAQAGRGRGGWRAVAAVAAAGLLVALVADRPTQAGGRVAGSVGALHTHWRTDPPPDAGETERRIVRIGQVAHALASGDGALATVVFPAEALGHYEPASFEALRAQVLTPLRNTGQTVLVGAAILAGPVQFAPAVLVLRADGTSTWVAARSLSAPSGWFDTTSVAVSRGGRARIVFASEEHVALLYLLAQARETFDMLIAVADFSRAPSGLANSMGAASVEGAARLWRQPWVRAVNAPEGSGSVAPK